MFQGSTSLAFEVDPSSLAVKINHPSLVTPSLADSSLVAPSLAIPSLAVPS